MQGHLPYSVAELAVGGNPPTLPALGQSLYGQPGGLDLEANLGLSLEQQLLLHYKAAEQQAQAYQQQPHLGFPGATQSLWPRPQAGSRIATAQNPGPSRGPAYVDQVWLWNIALVLKKQLSYPSTKPAQSQTVEKLRREVNMLKSTIERLEHEVQRQRQLRSFTPAALHQGKRNIFRPTLISRDTERAEFTEAKERLKHSWAADREDFARVKEALKRKNAEHHLHSNRLSSQLKVSCSASPCTTLLHQIWLI